MNFKMQLEPSVSLTEMEGKTVLFSKKTGDFFGLNETATYLVRQLLESDFRSTLERGISFFGADPIRLQADIQEMADCLIQMKLAKRIPI